MRWAVSLKESNSVKKSAENAVSKILCPNYDHSRQNQLEYRQKESPDASHFQRCIGAFHLSECDKRDTLLFYSFGFRILDTSVTCRFSFFIQPFDFLLLLWNFNFLKFMCHWFLPQKPICNVMYILYIYNTPSYIVLYSFLLEL